ncbi:Uma2 family endonuclease [Streptomyces litchfieldiae]|uniref:Uma2 family endonuclease n=1 Tax=Streptomyces litchfieldiae TaxID=3075543 RepID=A0ABU2MUV8_9ACTN|nr:Uma2 family endonuclease [Streptomyces sp. DSM 44938]MDT0345256.1 Uma2 family endonuclease [Streptomyces sp. DSM 44938]
MTVMMERPSTISTPEQTEFEKLCRTLEQLDVPVGYRAEIIGGSIVMTPWSQGFYLDVMESLADQLRPHAPKGHRVSVAPCLYVFPQWERGFGPDLHVADAGATRVRSIRLPGEALSLVAELTSESTAERDRSDKVERYGKAGVPVYVLVDMLTFRVVVFSRPGEDGYRTHNEFKFGETVRIPEPFDCKLDTSGWES